MEDLVDTEVMDLMAAAAIRQQEAMATVVAVLVSGLAVSR